MKIGLLTDALGHLSRNETLKWCAGAGLDLVELGTGGYSDTPHADLAQLISDAASRDRLAGEVADHGLELGAFNVSGNILHPNQAIADKHRADFKATIQLAQQMKVNTVVAMSGCPGGPGGGAWPVFAGGAWLPDMENLWEWQWTESIAPAWQELSVWAASEAPDVQICLELHPGTSIYNASSFDLLRTVTGENVRVNLDPSHFWWQGMDPVTVVDALPGVIGWSHGKDTTLHADRINEHGVLDYRWPATAEVMPWHFSAVGTGHSTQEWATLIEAMVRSGLDSAISIEHEDPTLSPEDGILASLSGIRSALHLRQLQNQGATE